MFALFFFALFFLCRGDNFLMEEIVDHNRRGVERTFYGVVVADIQKPLIGAKLPHLRVQICPIAAIAFFINRVVQRHQVGVLFCDIVENGLFVAAAQVEVFQPN